MSSVMLEPYNAVPLLIYYFPERTREGRRKKVIAAFLMADDSTLYIAYSATVAEVMDDVIKSMPYIDPSRKKLLQFRLGMVRISATGFAVNASTQGELDLIAELLRYLFSVAVARKVQIRRFADMSKIYRGTLTRTEKRIIQEARKKYVELIISQERTDTSPQ